MGLEFGFLGSGSGSGRAGTIGASIFGSSQLKRGVVRSNNKMYVFMGAIASTFLF